MEIPAKSLKLKIDLNGHDLTNSNSHTIVNRSTNSFTITDSKSGGIVDNVTHGKAAIYNDINANITLSGGTYMRSAEASTGDSASGGNSYYVIKNFGSMTINSSVTVKFSDENQGLYSSLIGNGWQNAAAAEEGTNGEPKPSESKNKATLTINNGTFTGGQITVKNDDYGTLMIKNGTFIQSGEGRSAVANNHKATISGGTFNSTTGPVVYSRHYDGEANDGTLTISGGTFTSTGSSAVALSTSGAKVDIKGGTFDAGDSSHCVSCVEGASAQISAGTFKAADADKICNLANAFVPSYGAVKNENGNFTVQVTDGEAVVIAQDGTVTQYATLKAAMAAVKTGGTVQLRRDITLTVGVETGAVSGITLNLNGYNIDGTAVKSADGVVRMQAKYGWKPVEGIDPTMQIINSVSGQGGEIKGKLPVQFKSGNSSYELPGIIGEGVTLTVTGEGTDTVKLGSSAYLVYNETTKNYIKNGGFKVTADDGTERIYGSYSSAAGKAHNGVVTMLNDYTGSERIFSGSSTGILDLNGKTYNFTTTDTAVTVNYDNVVLTIKNGSIITQNEKADGIQALYKNSGIILENVTMNVPGNCYGIVTNGTNTGNTVTLKNSTLNVPNGFGIYFPSNGTLVIENSTINAKETGVEFRAGTLTVTDSTITAKDAFSEKPNGNGTTMTGVAVAVSQHTTNHAIDVTINGDSVLKADKALYEKDLQDETSNNIEMSVTNGKFNGDVYSENCKNFITGGHFTSDPSAYVADGYAALPGTETGYAFTVGTKPNAETKVEPAAGEPVVDMSAIPEASQKDAEAVAKSVEDKGELAAAANSVLNTVTAEEKAAAEKALEETLQTAGSKVTTYVQTYLDIKPTAYDANAKTFTLDITPMYRVVASTADNAKDIVVKGEEGQSETANAVVLEGSATELTTLKAMTISVTLPDSWTALDNNKVYVQHKNHEYVATVTNNVATFTNPHGFSEFVFSVTPAAEAEMNGERYMNLSDALNAAKDGDIVTVLKNNLTASMSGDSRTITLKNGTKGKITVNVNNEDYTLNAKNDTVKVTYTRPSSSGNSSGSSNRTLTFNVNGGSELKKLTKAKGTTIDLSDYTPTRTGYTFAGWYSDKELTEKVTSVKLSENTIVYAKWTKNADETVAGFTDVKTGDWFAEEVQYVVDKGLMSGTSKTTFAPSATTTRGMIVAILHRLEKEPAATASAFTDVKAGAYYEKAINWAAANDIVKGVTETTFAPDQAITREQMAAILYRYAQFKGYDMSKANKLDAYADAAQVSAYAVPAMQWANAENLITGKSATVLDPKGNATRAEVSSILMRFCENIAK